MIIFSVEQNHLFGTENLLNTLDVGQRLYELEQRFTVVEGVYKGQTEQAFLIRDKELGKKIAREYDQESVLEQGYNGCWYLIDLKSDKVLRSFKQLKEVTETEAELEENYSFINGKYYIGE